MKGTICGVTKREARPPGVPLDIRKFTCLRFWSYAFLVGCMTCGAHVMIGSHFTESEAESEQAQAEHFVRELLPAEASGSGWVRNYGCVFIYTNSVASEQSAEQAAIGFHVNIIVPVGLLTKQRLTYSYQSRVCTKLGGAGGRSGDHGWIGQHLWAADGVVVPRLCLSIRRAQQCKRR